MGAKPRDSRLRSLREEGAVLERDVARRTMHGDEGQLLWDFIVSFVAARRTFLSIFRLYERRVVGSASHLGVARQSLVLPPRQLFDLFHLQRMKWLKAARLRPMRDLAERVFADKEDEELLDVYCSHIYHEFSILSEEHRSVGRFLRIHDRRRYRQLFEEVSGYYPIRLRRIRRLFTGGLRRIETMLPEWSKHTVIVRSVYLFGDQLAHRAYGRGVDAIYSRMYPEGGEVLGYVEAARSFLGAGFMIRAREAAQRGQEAARRIEERRPLERMEERARDEVTALLKRLDEEAGVAPEDTAA